MRPSTIRGIHGILSGAFAAAQRWEWTDRNPTESAKPPTATRQPIPATSPEDVAKVIAEARRRSAALGLYLWLVVVTGARRGELCGLQACDIYLDQGLIHVAFNYVVRGGQRIRKDTKTHQDRWLAIDPDTCALIAAELNEIRAALAAVGAELADDAYLFSNDPAHAQPWNPDWATHKVTDAAAAAGVELDITPTSGSWRNMVEIFFGIITRQAIRRGSFTSVPQLIAKIEAFIDGWNDRRPFTWTKTADELLPHARLGKRTSFTRH